MMETLKCINDGLDGLAAMIIQRECYEDPDTQQQALHDVMIVFYGELTRLSRLLGKIEGEYDPCM